MLAHRQKVNNAQGNGGGAAIGITLDSRQKVGRSASRREKGKRRRLFEKFKRSDYAARCRALKHNFDVILFFAKRPNTGDARLGNVEDGLRITHAKGREE